LAGASAMTIECHSSFADPGASAADVCAGSLPVSVTGAVDAATVGTYTLTYAATDPSGNAASATITVHVVDTTSPVVTLAGASDMTVECHTAFGDAGAAA